MTRMFRSAFSIVTKVYSARVKTYVIFMKNNLLRTRFLDRAA
jgi:hypothetical protein